MMSLYKTLVRPQRCMY